MFKDPVVQFAAYIILLAIVMMTFAAVLEIQDACIYAPHLQSKN